MTTLVLAIIFGLGFTWIASQNPTWVLLNFAGFALELPVYIIGAASFLLGIFITTVFNVFDFSNDSVRLAKKENEFNSISRENENLKKIIQKLEMDKANLITELHQKKTEHKERIAQERKENIKGFFDRIFHPTPGSPSHLS